MRPHCQSRPNITASGSAAQLLGRPLLTATLPAVTAADLAFRPGGYLVTCWGWTRVWAAIKSEYCSYRATEAGWQWVLSSYRALLAIQPAPATRAAHANDHEATQPQLTAPPSTRQHGPQFLACGHSDTTRWRRNKGSRTRQVLVPAGQSGSSSGGERSQQRLCPPLCSVPLA